MPESCRRDAGKSGAAGTFLEGRMELKGVERFSSIKNLLLPACSRSFKAALPSLSDAKENKRCVSEAQRTNRNRIRPAPSWLRQTCGAVASAPRFMQWQQDADELSSRRTSCLKPRLQTSSEPPSVAGLRPRRLANQARHSSCTCPAHHFTHLVLYHKYTGGVLDLCSSDTSSPSHPRQSLLLLPLTSRRRTSLNTAGMPAPCGNFLE